MIPEDDLSADLQTELGRTHLTMQETGLKLHLQSTGTSAGAETVVLRRQQSGKAHCL